MVGERCDLDVQLIRWTGSVSAVDLIQVHPIASVSRYGDLYRRSKFIQLHDINYTVFLLLFSCSFTKIHRVASLRWPWINHWLSHDYHIWTLSSAVHDHFSTHKNLFLLSPDYFKDNLLVHTFNSSSSVSRSLDVDDSRRLPVVFGVYDL